MNRVFLISIIFLVFSSCKQNHEENELKLFSQMEKQGTIIDSVPIGKELPLNYTHFDSVNIPKGAKEKIRSRIIPLATQNRDTHERTDTIPFAPESVTIATKPEIKKIEPYISKVQHPKPVKAGDLKSTGLSNENIMYLNEEQGLPSSNVRDAIEDPLGCMWIAQGIGLTKYDGYNFYTYNTKSGLPGGNINKVLISKDSTIWLATSGGLVHYNGYLFEIYNKECGLPSSNVVDISLDKNGNVWFVLFETGICKLQGNTLKFFGQESGIRPGAVYLIEVDDINNRVVLGNWGGCPEYIENEKVLRHFRKDHETNVMKRLADQHLFGSDVTTSIYKNKNGNLWFGSYSGGAALVTKDKTLIYKPKTGVPYFLISAVYEDSKGKVWFCTGEGGVACMTPDGYVCYTSKQGLTSNKITCITEDSQKNIWIGTHDGGINRIKPNSFRNYSSLDGISDKGVSSLYVNRKGHVLIGTWGAGIYAFNGTYFASLGGNPNPRSAIVLSMAEDSNGNLYHGVHQGGVQKFTPNDNDSAGYDSIIALGSIKHFKNSFPSALLYRNNEMWIGNLDNDFTRFKFNSFDKLDNKSGLIKGSVSRMVSDANNTIWIVNPGAGMSRIRDNKITHFSKANGLPSNDVITLYVDSKQNLWIGTNAGICKYNGKTFVCYDQKDGLTNNYVSSIIEDHKHRIWLGTARGLNVLYPDSAKAKSYGIDYFLLQDGLKSNYFVNHAAVMDKNNNLWWGTSKGAIKLNLDDYDSKRNSPPCYMAQIGLMDEYVNFAALQDSIKKNVAYFNSDSTQRLNAVEYNSVSLFNNLPNDLSLPYYLNTLNFNFYAFSGHSSHRLKYRYRLLGTSDAWINVNYPEAKYSNLDAGKYTFEAQAKLEGEDWGKSCSYSFEIEPPFWKTVWFIVLSIAVIVYSIVLIFRFRNKQLLDRQEQLETTVKERTHEIEHQKHLIEEKQKEIVDSINYAKRIQYALLANEEFLKENIPQHFILFNPKDIVSGDFYWAVKKGDRFYLAVCDSTGHGVPGAFMSLLSIGFLTEAISEKNIEKPNEVFDFVRQRLINNISKEGQKDGFDGILICIDSKTKKITYASANNQPIIISDHKVHEQEKDRMPVGMGERQNGFKLFEIDIKANDVLYLYTDGFADQFGGPKGKKFKYGKLNQMLLDISDKPMEEQRDILQLAFNEWRGDLEQVDDVCVIGLRV